MIAARIAALLVAGAALTPASSASAQSADPPASRVEVGAGGMWIGRQVLGAGTVTETTASGGTRALFTQSSELGGIAGVSVRAGVRLTRSLVVEAEGTYLKPPLRITLSDDVEGAAAVTATETVEQFTAGGGLLWYLPIRSSRFAPFARAGGGYLRQLHEQATLVDTGRYVEVGGGASLLLVAARHFHTKGMGVRIDIRALRRSKGVKFDGGSTTSPAASVSAFVRF
ncbi:MAG: hypothetical protein JWL71_3475 [Acidobacteria bacterium]|nr:hypothetical protein [Acidobacteriota bacterium]